uniref:Uncharacterized protein n=1 Tax=viral metagenome TaxID=1070528 RepID=A0A6H1ZPR8_9ZZZZ
MAVLLGIDRAIWRTFAFNTFKQGYSFNYSLRLFRDMGFSVQRAWGLSQWRQVNNLVLGWKAAAGVDRSKVFPTGKMIEAESLKGWRYEVRGYAKYFDQSGNMYSQHEVAFRTNRHLSLTGYEGIAERNFKKSETTPGAEHIEVNFQVVAHEQGLSY